MQTFDIVVNIVYAMGVISVVLLLINALKSHKGSYLSMCFVTGFWICGEFFFLQQQSVTGASFYAMGHFILFIFLAYIYSDISYNIFSFLIALTCLIIFSGYFWPENLHGREYVNVINLVTIVLCLSIGYIFVLNTSNNKWLYVYICVAVSLWCGWIMIHYYRTGIIINTNIPMKCMVGPILPFLAYRLYRQNKELSRDAGGHNT